MSVLANGRLTGKTCLVTGAAQGIGRATVDAFLREGARVVAIDLQEAKLGELPPGEQLLTHALDVTDGAAAASLALAHGDVAVLVNCVGTVDDGTALDCDSESLERSFRVNVLSMHNTIRAFLPGMRERRDGAILNIASVVSSVRAAPRRYAYATTKAAVIGLTKAVARDFAADGVRCNCISPGTVLSPSLVQRMSARGDFDAAHAAFVARQPMGRLGLPEEIAAVAVLLASDEARFMTGANVVIDGGMSL